MALPHDLITRTRSTLADLRSAVNGLEERDFSRLTRSGWTVSATLAHLAFWDDWVAQRWQRWQENGRFDDLPDEVTELVNGAAIRIWKTVPPELTRSAVLEAAGHVAAVIYGLPESALEGALSTGRSAMIDRSLHWRPHLDEIQEATQT